MIVESIVRIEEQNYDRIYLHREGTFLKAYDHSAYFIWKYISPFKLHWKFVKKINRNLAYCGFPENSLGKWMHGYVCKEVDKDLFECEFGQPFSETEYLAFQDEARLQESAALQFSPRKSIIEKQAVYQTAVDLANYCLMVGRNIPRTDLVPYGNELKIHSYELAYKVGKLYDYPDREAAVREMVEHIERVNFVLKMLRDSRAITDKSLGEAGQMAEGIRSQLEALKRPATKDTVEAKDAPTASE